LFESIELFSKFGFRASRQKKLQRRFKSTICIQKCCYE